MKSTGTVKKINVETLVDFLQLNTNFADTLSVINNH